MKVLVLGGGGREHALVWRLARDATVREIHAAPGNPGIAGLAACHPVKAEDRRAVVDLACRLQPDLVVVGPEAPLAAGIVDHLDAAGILAFGPTQAAAQLETSKAFAKDLMARAGIPTAAYGAFEDLAEAERFIRRHGAPLVVKADGLFAGKGVVIAAETDQAIAAARAMLVEGDFGDAGRRIIIEEFLTGDEVSIIALCDGRRALTLAPSQDHKAAYDGDTGPNTGGMGAYSPVPFVSRDLVAQFSRTVLDPTVAALADAGCEFRGVLYAGLMLTADGPKVLEYNVRFGDPEAQVLLPRLQGPFAAALVAAARGNLDELPEPLTWSPHAAACVVMAAPGYPGDYPKGIALRGLADAEALAAQQSRRLVIFHAATATDPETGELVSAGGRVLGVTAIAAELRAALDLAYAAADRIDFAGAHMRRDIGHRALGR